MSKTPSPTAPPDADTTAHRFFTVQELLMTPELARFYTDLLINSPTTIPAARNRQGFSKSTAYKYASRLEELGVVTESNEYENGSALWAAEPVSGVWTGETAVEIGPVIIAVFGATSVDDDLELFVERHSKAAIVPAVLATVEYLQGNITRRGVADKLDVPAVEGIAVTQAVEHIIAVVKDADPTLNEVTFEVDVHKRATDQAQYRRSNE